MKLVSVQQMRTLDQQTIEEFGTPGEILMERAGIGASEYLLDYLETLNPRHVKRLVFLAGKGNNGGDAYVMARYLYQHLDVEILVWSICAKDDLKGDALLNAKRLPEEIEYKTCLQLSKEDFNPGDIIIDGLLGTGIKGELKPPYDNWIKTINAVPYPTISLDIPSGLNGDNGTFKTEAVQANLTISMGLPKQGYTVEDGPKYCGSLRNVEIGIPQDYINAVNANYHMLFEHDIQPFLSPLSSLSHKGSQGKVLIIGGSQYYKGAPFLSAKSALRSGAGLVYLAIPETNMPHCSESSAIIVQNIFDDNKGYFTNASVEQINKLIEHVDSIVIGPGMSNHPECMDFLINLDSKGKPVVYDADALNLLAANATTWSPLINAILTPHPGEMRRLLCGFGLERYLEKTRLDQAETLADKLNAVVVLKGHQTIISVPGGGKTAINSSGSPALATAGSGDVLSGMIGAWLPVTETVSDAAKIATFIHGLAGELNPNGHRGLTADDLVDQIPQAMKYISPFA